MLGQILLKTDLLLLLPSNWDICLKKEEKKKRNIGRDLLFLLFVVVDENDYSRWNSWLTERPFSWTETTDGGRKPSLYVGRVAQSHVLVSPDIQQPTLTAKTRAERGVNSIPEYSHDAL